MTSGCAPPDNDEIPNPELPTPLLTRLDSGLAQLRGVKRGIRVAPPGLASEPYEVMADKGDMQQRLQVAAAQQRARRLPEERTIIRKDPDPNDDVGEQTDPHHDVRSVDTRRRVRRLDAIREDMLELIREAAIDRLGCVGGREDALPHAHDLVIRHPKRDVRLSRRIVDEAP